MYRAWLSARLTALGFDVRRLFVLLLLCCLSAVPLVLFRPVDRLCVFDGHMAAGMVAT